MLHGHTRITLRNPISGNILKDIESENTFQSTALQNFTHCLGEDSHGIPSYDWEDLVGGILLFKDSITVQNDVRSWYMPSSNVMVGNSAVGISNSSAPNELGSYTGGSASTSGITQNYEFLTTQANGEIGCVCLTSKIGGQIGYGNASGRRTDIDFGQGQTASVGGSINSAIVNNMLYTFTLSGDILTVQKTRKSITQGNVFRGLHNQVAIDLTSEKPSGSTLSESLSVFALNNGKIRIYSPITPTIASGNNVYYFDYDPSDDSVTLGSFANSASKAIRGDVVALSFTPDNYCVTYDTNLYLQVFNVSNGTHVMDYMTEQLLRNLASGNYDLPLNDGLLLNLSSGAGFIVNYNLGSVKPLNITGAGNYSVFTKRYPSIDSLIYTSANTPRLIKNPLYLATINNLQTPVTKTSASTMKVTYTLTES